MPGNLENTSVDPTELDLQIAMATALEDGDLELFQGLQNSIGFQSIQAGKTTLAGKTLETYPDFTMFAVASNGNCGPLALATAILVLLKTHTLSLAKIFHAGTPHGLLKEVFERSEFRLDNLEKWLTPLRTEHSNLVPISLVEKLARSIRFYLSSIKFKDYLSPYFKKEELGAYLEEIIEQSVDENIQREKVYVDMHSLRLFSLACGMNLSYISETQHDASNEIISEMHSLDYSERLQNLPRVNIHYSHGSRHFEPAFTQEQISTIASMETFIAMPELLAEEKQKPFDVAIQANTEKNFLDTLIIFFKIIWMNLLGAYLAYKRDQQLIDSLKNYFNAERRDHDQILMDRLKKRVTQKPNDHMDFTLTCV